MIVFLAVTEVRRESPDCILPPFSLAGETTMQSVAEKGSFIFTS